MTDAELLSGLATLGIDRTSYRVILLLPLVQVAWADGRIQSQERELILRVAEEHGLLSGPSGDVLRGWLAQAPTQEQIETGRRLLVALTHRPRGMGSELDSSALEDVKQLSLEVAQAAGGLFDSLFTVEEAERAALDEISIEFGQQRARLLEDLPTPEGGGWTDLDDELA